MKTIYTVLLVYLIAGCGEGNTESTEALLATEEVTPETKDALYLEKKSDMSSCEKGNKGQLIFVEEDSQFYFCSNKTGGWEIVVFNVPAGKDGKDGKDGASGKDGKDGREGIDGKDGVNGKDGVDGLAGEKGERGEKGEKGDAGIDGIQGLAGRDGRNGVDGRNGIDGTDGTEGEDAPYVGADTWIDPVNGNKWFLGARLSPREAAQASSLCGSPATAPSAQDLSEAILNGFVDGMMPTAGTYGHYYVGKNHNFVRNGANDTVAQIILLNTTQIRTTPYDIDYTLYTDVTKFRTLCVLK